MSEKFYLSRDDDGHWFVVPVNSSNQWTHYLENIIYSEKPDYSIPLPKGVMKVGGAPSLVQFENPIIL